MSLLKDFHNRAQEQAKLQADDVEPEDRRAYIEKNMYIRTKDKKVINFLFNPIQALYWMEKTKRDIILKPRQLGFSTLKIAEFFERVINEKNVTAVIIAHDADSTQKMFQTVQLMYLNLPEEKKLQLNGGKGKPKVGNKKEFFFAGLNSRIYVGTAGTSTFGRSQTLNYVLCSEVAFWPNPEEIMTGLMQSVPMDGEVTIESTANGMGNYYHQTYWDGRKGGNNWKSHFYAWFQHPEYRLPIGEKEVLEYDADEKELIASYAVDDGQLKWRRWKISEMPQRPDRSKEDVFRQEYPSNELEAFLSTGLPVFDIKKVRARYEYLQKLYKEKPPIRGSFTYKYQNEKILANTIKFVEDPNGVVTIYENPERVTPFVMGGDTAEGGVDYSAGQMLNNISGNQAAVWHGHEDTDLYAKQMYCYGKYFNYAVLAIEMNFDLHPVKELSRLGYRRQYKREVMDEITGEKQNKFGFHTTSITRPVIIAELVTVVRESIHLINDLATLEEMMTFVRNKNGRPEAQTGKHDDLIMSLAIAHQARSQQRMTPYEDEEELEDHVIAFGNTGY